MANTYHSILTAGTPAAFDGVLQTKYGAGYTKHFLDASNLVFSCAALSNKVIKIEYSWSKLMLYYGDAWTSGSTITNQVQFFGESTMASTPTEIHLILGSNTALICAPLGQYMLGCISLFGKMTNDKYAVLSMTGGSTYNSNFIGRNTSDNVGISPISFSDSFASATGKMYKMPLILQRADNLIEQTVAGDFASFADVYVSSHAFGNNTTHIGANFLLSPSGLYLGSGTTVKRLYTSLIAEF